MNDLNKDKDIKLADKNSTKILGVKIDLLSKREVLECVRRVLEKQENSPEDIEPCLLSTTNPEFIMAAQKDEEFKKIINNSFLSVPDGIGVLYANYYLNHLKGNFKKWISSLLKRDKERRLVRDKFGERITGVELVYDLCQLAEKEGHNVFLLGGWPTDYWGRPLKNPDYDLAKKAGKKLKEMYPELNLVGATSNFSYLQEDDEQTLDFIKKRMREAGVKNLDILIVCYGHKNQEKWIVRNAKKIPARLCMGAGGTFDYVTENKSWAPLWIQRIHLEWLYRLVTQPWRIRRIFISFPLFPLKVFFSSL